MRTPTTCSNPGIALHQGNLEQDQGHHELQHRRLNHRKIHRPWASCESSSVVLGYKATQEPLEKAKYEIVDAHVEKHDGKLHE